jgi:hypothetical protein
MARKSAEYEEDFDAWTVEQARLLHSRLDRPAGKFFPKTCPFTPDEILSHHYLPER